MYCIHSSHSLSIYTLYIYIQDGATPLIIAAQWGHTQLVDCLLDHDADTTPQLVDLLFFMIYKLIFFSQSTGQTALHLAASEGFTDIVSLLHCKNKELLGCCDNVGKV